MIKKGIFLINTFLETDYKQHIKRAFLWLSLVAFAVGFVYIFGQVYDRPAKGEFFQPELVDATAPIKEGDILSQEITFTLDKVSSMWLHFDASMAKETVMYLVTLYDEAGEMVQRNDFKTSEAESPVNFLVKPITGVLNKTYRLEIQVVRTTLNSAAAFLTMQNCNFAPPAVLNGEALQSPIAIQLNAAAAGTSTWVVVLVLLSGLLAAVLLLTGKNHVWNTVIIILAFGAFICVLNPLGDAPDEYAHYLRAEALSKGMVFGTATTEFASDSELRNIMLMGNQQSNTFARFSDASLYSIKAGVQEGMVQAGTAGNYFFLGYLASAIGIWIGKAFHMSAMLCLYFSRFLNVAFYAALCGMAVAVTPRLKKTFSFIACLPMCMFLASSLSPDGITVGLALLSTALFLWITQQKQGSVELWHTGLWLLITLCTALTRIPYVLLLLLILLIPKKAYRLPKAQKWVLLQLGSSILLALLWAYFSGLNGLRAIDGADSGAQIAFIMHNLPLSLNIIFSTFIQEIYNLIQGLFLLGWQTYNISWIGIFLPFMLLHLAESEALLLVQINKKGRTLAILAISIYAVTYLGMYITSNAVGVGAILGVQGRYFLSLFALLPIWLSRFAKDKPVWKYTGIAFSCFLLSVLSAAIIVRNYM